MCVEELSSHPPSAVVREDSYCKRGSVCVCVCDCVSVAISYRQVQGEKGAGPVCGVAGLTRTGSKGHSQQCVQAEVGISATAS